MVGWGRGSEIGKDGGLALWWGGGGKRGEGVGNREGRGLSATVSILRHLASS